VPSAAGTALPATGPVIQPVNAGQLALFGEWGGGIPQGIAYAPDGARVAVVSTRGLYIYAAPSLDIERHIDPGMALRSVAFAPDGSLAAGGEDGRILIYQPDNGELVQELEGHKGPVFALSFSPDGDRLVSGGWDRTVRLWRWAEARQLRLFEGHTSPPRQVFFSPDGELLYSWSPEDQLRILPLSDRQPPQPIYLGIDARRKSGSSAGFSGSGEFFAVDQDERVRLIFTRTGNTRVMLSNFPQPVEKVIISADGTRVATASQDGIRVWDGQSGQLLGELFSPPGTWPGSLMAFSPDGSQIVAAGDMVRLWQLEASELAAAAEQPTFQNGYRIFSRPAPDGEAIWNGLSVGQLQPLELADGGLLPVTGRPMSASNALAVSPDGAWMAAAGTDRSILIWNTEDDTQQVTLTGSQQIPLSLAFSPDSTLLAAATGEEIVRVWQLEAGGLAAELEAPDPVTQVRFSPDGAWLAGGSRLQTSLWQAADWQLQETLPGRGLVFSEDAQHMALLVDVGDRKQAVIGTPGGTEQVTAQAQGSAVTFSPDGDILAVSGVEMSLYDVSDGDLLLQVESPAPHGRIFFSPDGRKLLLTAPDGVVYVYALP
jgi:WD40 repeat protein